VTHEFEIKLEIEVDATPEEVWEAIATGPGVDSWFMGRNEIEPREGGKARTTLSGFTMEGTITAWDPPKRFAQQSDEGPDGSLHAFEFLIEGRDQGSTVVRMVHSGFLGDNWEAEYDGLSEGDPMYLDKLAQYLTYFRGQTATPIDMHGPQVPDREHAWSVYRNGLGLPGPVALGDQVRLTPRGLPPIEGVVDYLSPSFLGVRARDGLYRFIYGYDGTVVLGHHLFSNDVDQKETEEAWRSWLDRTFADAR
jgi:uncharacterized protein YndB with AHSA1/START domain